MPVADISREVEKAGGIGVVSGEAWSCITQEVGKWGCNMCMRCEVGVGKLRHFY